MGNWIDGRNIIVGAKKATTWRTAVQVGAGEGLLVTSESGFTKAPNYVPDDSLGLIDIREYYKVSEAVTGGTINGYLRYEGWDLLLALALGSTAGTPSNVEGSAYYNTYYVADSVDGKFCTLVFKKKAAGSNKDIWEVPSAKIMGFTISAQVGQLATISFNIMGNKIENQSSVNDNTTVASITEPTKSHLAILDTRSKIRMNSQSGAALTDDDRIYPTSFEITYSRPFREDYEASYNDMSEPLQNGYPDTTIKLGFNKYDLDDFMDAIEADSEFKMDILLEGRTITGTSTRYAFIFEMPKVVWHEADSPAGSADTIPHDVTGRMLRVDSAPTGMSYTTPLNITVYNTRSTDPLA